MKLFISPRYFGALLALTALSLRAQDHADPAAEKAAADRANTPAPGAFQKKGGGRGKGGAGAAAPAQGGRGLSPAELSTDLEKIIANPAELAKGQKIFELQCVT